MTRLNPSATSCKSHNRYTFDDGYNARPQTPNRPPPPRQKRAQQLVKKLYSQACDAQKKRKAEKDGNRWWKLGGLGAGVVGRGVVTGASEAATGGAAAVALVGGAAAAIIPQLLLLRGLGKDHHDVQRQHEHRSYLRGIAETLGGALEQPELTPKQLLKRARESEHIDRLDTRARSRAWKKRDRKWAAARMETYMEGARKAIEWVRKLTPRDRAAVRDALARKLAGKDSTARLMDLFNTRGLRCGQ